MSKGNSKPTPIETTTMNVDWPYLKFSCEFFETEQRSDDGGNDHTKQEAGNKKRILNSFENCDSFFFQLSVSSTDDIISISKNTSENTHESQYINPRLVKLDQKKKLKYFSIRFFFPKNWFNFFCTSNFSSTEQTETTSKFTQIKFEYFRFCQRIHICFTFFSAFFIFFSLHFTQKVMKNTKLFLFGGTENSIRFFLVLYLFSFQFWSRIYSQTLISVTVT